MQSGAPFDDERGDEVLRKTIRPDLPIIIPNKQKTDVPWKTAGEIEHPRGQVKATRLQIVPPTQINLGSRAAQVWSQSGSGAFIADRGRA